MSSHPLQAVLFDLDGTLLDTAPEFHHIISQMLAAHGRPPIDYGQFRRCVSDGARGMVTTAFGCTADAPEFEPLRQELLALYAQQLAEHTRLFPGMAETLQFIERENLRWGIVTNKPSLFAEPLLAAMQLDQRCAVLICPDHVRARKPDPESLQLACARIGCTASAAVYIGDHRRDIEAARHARMASIACAYGYVHSEDPCETWQADFLVHDPRQIITILQKRVY